MLSQVTYSKSSTVDLGDTCRLLRKCQTLTAKLKVINVGTWTFKDAETKSKKKFIYEDTLKYSLQIIGLTETHISKEEISTNKNISIKKAKI